MSDKEKEKKQSDTLPNEMKKLNIIPFFGFTVFANTAVAGLIGYYIDKWTFDNNIILIISLIFGMISGLYNGIKELLKESKIYEEKEHKKEKNEEEIQDREK